MDPSEGIKNFRYFIKVLNYKNLYNLTGNILIKGCKLRLMSFFIFNANFVQST